MSYSNREILRTSIGKVGLFFDDEDDKMHIVGRLMAVTPNGNCEDEDGVYHDEFTPIGRAEMLELIDLDLYS